MTWYCIVGSLYFTKLSKSDSGKYECEVSSPLINEYKYSKVELTVIEQSKINM